jgi:hypothetical protein
MVIKIVVVLGAVIKRITAFIPNGFSELVVFACKAIVYKMTSWGNKSIGILQDTISISSPVTPKLEKGFRKICLLLIRNYFGKRGLINNF